MAQRRSQWAVLRPTTNSTPVPVTDPTHTDNGRETSTRPPRAPLRAMPTETKGVRKALWTVPEAMQLLSMSRSVIYELMRSGRLRAVKEGTKRLIPDAAITDYVALLEHESLGEAA